MSLTQTAGEAPEETEEELSRRVTTVTASVTFQMKKVNITALWEKHIRKR